MLSAKDFKSSCSSSFRTVFEALAKGEERKEKKNSAQKVAYFCLLYFFFFFLD